MNYLQAKKALRDTMSAEDYTETIDFSELIDTTIPQISYDMNNELWYETIVECDSIPIIDSQSPVWGYVTKDLLNNPTADSMETYMICDGFKPVKSR